MYLSKVISDKYLEGRKWSYWPNFLKVHWAKWESPEWPLSDSWVSLLCLNWRQLQYPLQGSVWSCQEWTLGPDMHLGHQGGLTPAAVVGFSSLRQTVAQRIWPCIRHEGWPSANLELAQIYAGFYWWTFVHFLWRIEFYPLKSGLGENGYMYMYGWIPSLFTWNYHNIANRLCAVLCLVTQSCLTLCDPMGCSLPGSAMGILQARILEWVVMPSSRGSSQPRYQTQVSRIAGRFFTIWATREAKEYLSGYPSPSPGDLCDPGIKLGTSALQANSLPAELPEKPH